MMAAKKESLLRIYFVACLTTVIILGLVWARASTADFFRVLILAALEITFSFDNAVVNARILSRMSPLWQQLFMTVGIIIAVFGVRVLFPIALVAVTAGLSLGSVVDLALHQPDVYSEKLLTAHPMIAAFGGFFLLMIALDFIVESREVKWLVPLENQLEKIGKLRFATVGFALVTLVVTCLILVHGDERVDVLVAGLVGIIIYLGIHALDKIFTPDEATKSVTASTFKAGMIGFLYLELIDASFSLDGVIGAFAITNKIMLIAAGLGIGALFVRSLTVHMLRRGVLNKYRYMEHGAHYAIGLLAFFMLLSLRFHIPEMVTGLSGITVIGLAIAHSRVEAKNNNDRLLF